MSARSPFSVPHPQPRSTPIIKVFSHVPSQDHLLRRLKEGPWGGRGCLPLFSQQAKTPFYSRDSLTWEEGRSSPLPPNQRAIHTFTVCIC